MMNVANIANWAEPDPAPTLGEVEGPFWYTMYGLRVRSDLRLPLGLPSRFDGTPPDWTFSCAESVGPAPEPEGPVVAEVRCHPDCEGPVIIRVHSGASGAWLWYRSIATFHISPDARRVEIYPVPGTDERFLRLVLAGQLSIFVLHKLGYPPLHASAVITPHGAVGFLGPKGQGKSTMAASFLVRGATLLTDDVLPVWVLDDGVFGAPGLPHMKVWPQTAERVLVAGELPNLLPNYDKRILLLGDRYPFADKRASLRGLFVLRPYNPDAVAKTTIDVHRLSKRDALAALLAHTSWLQLLSRQEAARLLGPYSQLVSQVPVHGLSFPIGFEHQELVHARIMAELEEP